MRVITAVLWVVLVLLSGMANAAPGDDVVVFVRQEWIWQCDGNGKRPRRLIEGVLPGLRPDGGRLAFFRTQGDPGQEKAELWLLDMATGSTSSFGFVPRPGSPPVWIGSVVAYLAMDDQARTLIVTVETTGPQIRTIFTEGDHGTGFLCSLAAAADNTLLVHDMRNLLRIDLQGRLVATTPLSRIMGRYAENVTSSDRLAVCPTDPTVMVFSHSVPGTKLFERVMHEPNTALSLHDSFVGVGKNMRITAAEITAFDPVWSRDGKCLYFVGYRDTQAAEADLFRVFRVGRFGSDLKELTLGEQVCVGASGSGEK